MKIKSRDSLRQTALLVTVLATLLVTLGLVSAPGAAADKQTGGKILKAVAGSRAAAAKGSTFTMQSGISNRKPSSTVVVYQRPDRYEVRLRETGDSAGGDLTRFLGKNVYRRLADTLTPGQLDVVRAGYPAAVWVKIGSTNPPYRFDGQFTDLVTAVLATSEWTTSAKNSTTTFRGKVDGSRFRTSQPWFGASTGTGSVTIVLDKRGRVSRYTLVGVERVITTVNVTYGVRAVPMPGDHEVIDEVALESSLTPVTEDGYTVVTGLSQSCTAALEDLRTLEQRVPDGSTLTQENGLGIVMAALEAAAEVCTVEERLRIERDEVAGYLAGAARRD